MDIKIKGYDFEPIKRKRRSQKKVGAKINSHERV